MVVAVFSRASKYRSVLHSDDTHLLPVQIGFFPKDDRRTKSRWYDATEKGERNQTKQSELTTLIGREMRMSI